MLISWINRFSLIEFPWEICSVIFTLWCNFRCDYCHNSEFVLPEKIAKLKTNIIPQKAIFNFLESRKWQLSWVSICWWEPTMQKDLFEFCKKVKSMWFLVKLDTNGRDPDILQKLLAEKMVDYKTRNLKIFWSCLSRAWWNKLFEIYWHNPKFKHKLWIQNNSYKMSTF